MQAPKVDPERIDYTDKMTAPEKERLALESLLDYVMSTAAQSHFSGAGDNLETARRRLSDSLFC